MAHSVAGGASGTRSDVPVDQAVPVTSGFPVDQVVLTDPTLLADPSVDGDGTGGGAGDPLSYRDADFVLAKIPVVERFIGYFSPEVIGLDHIPATGPAFLVGNHSCLFWMPDAWVVARSITERRGVEQPSYALGYDLLFKLPVVGEFLRKVGAIPADGVTAQRALADGDLVLDYPGGDREACRPWLDRNRVEFGGRTGFVKLALRTGVPVVPVVTHGSHDAIVVLTRGEHVARALHLDKLRIKVFPIFLGPFGVSTILRPPLPLPSAVTVEFLPPFDWSRFGPDAADDPDTVAACYDEITSAMQAALDRLAAERPHPVLRGIGRLLTGHGLRFLPADPSRTPPGTPDR